MYNRNNRLVYGLRTLFKSGMTVHTFQFTPTPRLNNEFPVGQTDTSSQ